MQLGLKMWTQMVSGAQKSLLAIYYIFWFRISTYLLPSSLSIAMKRALHKGSSVHLNIYTVGLLDSNSSGYAHYPISYASRPTQDGVVLKYNTLPGGSSTTRQGGTLVHETGHWLGLKHTFDGGCTGGDGVADTPPEAVPAYGCPIGRKTCSNSSLPDPIRKYLAFMSLRPLVIFLLSRQLYGLHERNLQDRIHSWADQSHA
jgi:hypothetical protein